MRITVRLRAVVAVLIGLLAFSPVAMANHRRDAQHPKRSFRPNGEPKKRTYVRPSVDKHGHRRRGHYARE